MAVSSSEVSSAELVEFLGRPESYPHTPTSVELRETHISWVFVAGRYAYKLKKPVRFDFLDFSTCALREAACHAELRLNRRLSPHVYRDVVPICRDASSHLNLASDGEVVDWLVKMRRLDDRRTLAALLERSTSPDATKSAVDDVAAHLAQFYATQAPVTVRTDDFRENLRRHIENTEHQLYESAISDSEREIIQVTHSAQKRFLVTHQDMFDDRVRDGRIIDGHGDLRPEHIYLYNRPLIIDCIEFNSEYRTNDIVDELAFLAMECDRLGHRFVGPTLAEQYGDASHDRPSAQLMTFYKLYRACVRAKVAAIRSQQTSPVALISRLSSSEKEACQYLRLASSYVAEVAPRVIVIVGGLMGTGKTTLAHEVGTMLSAEVLSSDVVRDGQPHGNGHFPAGFGQGRYSMQSRLATYRSLMAEAQQAFRKNATIVLDATFTTATSRRLAADLAHSCSAKLLQVECTCPREVAIHRITERLSQGGSPSEALPQFYDRQAAETDPPIENAPWATVDTTMALALQRTVVLESFKDILR